MTPVERAAAVYDSEPCARSFREDLEAHLHNGYVFNTPDIFVMGRPVVSSENASDIIDPWIVFPVEQCDAWLVYLAAGRMDVLLSMFPYSLPKIGFERKNKLRFYGLPDLTHRLSTRCSTTLTLSAAHISTAN